MGNCSIQNNDYEETKSNLNYVNLALSIKNFEFVEQLGAGNFAKVWKVKRKKTSQYFAMKIMSKARYLQ